MRLQNKVALITGGGSGIGEATSELFAQEGAKVVVADVNRETADEVARRVEDTGGSAIAMLGDVSAREDAARLVAETVERFGRIDILVNSAGVSARGAPPGADFEDAWQRVIDTNLKGTWLMCRFAVQEMKKTGGGAIVNLASIIGLVGYHPGMSDGLNPYPQSKGAVVQLTRDLGVNQARNGIRTNCLCPGFTKTNLTKVLTDDPEMLQKLESLHPMGRLGEASEIAQAALFLASDEASFITGAVLTVDGGYTAQ